MAHSFNISTFGLTLIKAYEGFRSYETTLVSGQRVIGYGHRFQDNEEPTLTRKQAESLLKSDLAAYEDLVNENVRAPLSQSQFDALVSLSFNIGPKAFLSSDVLHALNNGRPLDAAHGFDQWRKSAIDGKTYVVDALVRRRTAEKALFLRTSDDLVTAPRHELPTHSDAEFVADEHPIFFDNKDAEHIVAQTPYAAKTDRNAYGDKAEIDLRETTPPAKPTPDNLSPIAIAAEEVSERLDRLIADAPNGEAHISVSPATPPEPKPKNEEKNIAEVIADIKAANEGTRPDYRRPAHANKSNVRAPKSFIHNLAEPKNESHNRGSFIAYWMALILGAILLGGGAMKWFLTPGGSFNQYQQFIAPLATTIGAMIVMVTLYYLAKTYTRKSI